MWAVHCGPREAAAEHHDAGRAISREQEAKLSSSAIRTLERSPFEAVERAYKLHQVPKLDFRLLECLSGGVEQCLIPWTPRCNRALLI